MFTTASMATNFTGSNVLSHVRKANNFLPFFLNVFSMFYYSCSCMNASQWLANLGRNYQPPTNEPTITLKISCSLIIIAICIRAVKWTISVIFIICLTASTTTFTFSMKKVFRFHVTNIIVFLVTILVLTIVISCKKVAKNSYQQNFQLCKSDQRHKILKQHQ